MVGLTHLTAADYRRMRWKNGGGWTTELAVAAGPDGGFVWRISVAEIDVDGDFSPFPGVDRSILVLTGAGMALTIGEAPAVELRAGDPPRRFSGDVAVGCRLLAGPTRDFNVMTRRGLARHEVLRAGPGARALAGTCFVYVASGSARAGALALAAGDSLRIEAVPEDRPVEVEADGELIVVRLTV